MSGLMSGLYAEAYKSRLKYEIICKGIYPLGYEKCKLVVLYTRSGIDSC
jgi:hypothetical protein